MHWMSGRAESDELGCHMTPTTHSLNKLLKDKYESMSFTSFKCKMRTLILKRGFFKDDKLNKLK